MDHRVDDLRPNPGDARGQDARDHGEERKGDGERPIGGPDQHERTPAVLEQAGEPPPPGRAAAVSLRVGVG